MYQEPFSRSSQVERREEAFEVLKYTAPVLERRFEDFCVKEYAFTPCTVDQEPLLFSFCSDFVTGRLLPRINKIDKSELLRAVPAAFSDQCQGRFYALAMAYHPDNQRFVFPMLNPRSLSNPNFWQNIKIWEAAECFDNGVAMIVRVTLPDGHKYLEPELKIYPVLIRDSLWQAHKQALELRRLITLMRRSSAGTTVKELPFGSVIIASLLNEAVSREDGMISGITGLRVPDQEAGEYELGLVTTVLPPNEGCGSSSTIITGFTEEKVHRFEVFVDHLGVLVTNWLGDDGERFGWRR